MEKIRDLKDQIEELKLQLSESQDIIQAIQNGEVDALVVHGPSDDQIYTLKDAEHPYRVMVETMNEGAATLAPDGTIFYCNHKLASLLNVEMSKIIGVQMSNFIIPAHVSAFQSVLQRGTLGTGRAEVELKSAKGASIPVLVSTQALFVENNQMVSLIVTDLSEHKRTEQIIASEKFAQTVLEQAANAVIVCDNDGIIIRASEKALNLIGTGIQGLYFDCVFEQFYPVLATGNPALQGISRKPVCLSSLYRGKIPTGSEIALIINGQAKQSFVINFSPLSQDNAIVGYSISLTDITSQKKAEEALAKTNEELEIRVKERTRELTLANEQLKRYSYRITRVQEEERKRVAYKLGEELAQTLAAIKLEADLMTEKVSSYIENVREMMGTVVQNTVTFSNELRPSVLGNLGLPEALEAIIGEICRNGELEIVLKTNGTQRRLHDEVETALFRIAQEAMDNIIKHSGATKAKVNLGFLKNGIKLTIIDNGKGFDTEREPDLKGVYGLISMKERAHQIGGEVKIKSEFEKGTIITVTVPLQLN